MQSRYYNPVWGRFINADDPELMKSVIETMLRDPAKSTDKLLLMSNMFAYCANNPVMNSDPSGYIAQVVVQIIIGMIGGLVAYIAKLVGKYWWGWRSHFNLTDAALVMLAGGIMAALGPWMKCLDRVLYPLAAQVAKYVSSGVATGIIAAISWRIFNR